MSAIRIGISGWSYAHWKHRFYPAEVKDADRLPFYARHFDTVEINSTFYRAPQPALLARWAACVPENFVFAVKGSRRFTHFQQLCADPAEVAAFFRALDPLAGKLGPILFQLPANVGPDVPVLAAFLKMIPRKFRVAFEFRHAGWWTQEVFDLLAASNAAFCIFDLRQTLSPISLTADFVYVRLHGPKRPYFDHYARAVLKGWAARIQAWPDGRDVFFYFNNTDEAAATADATLLREFCDAAPVAGKSAPGRTKPAPKRKPHAAPR